MTKILLIDDEEALLDEIAANLGYVGFEILKANSGEEGIAMAHQQLPDLIICDLMMPGVDGYGVLFELRSHPVTMKLPFIFLTARTDRETYREAMTRGADDYLTKPFTHNELLQAIHARLGKKAAEEEEFQQQVLALRQAYTASTRVFKPEHVVNIVGEMRGPVVALLWSNSLLRNYADSVSAERRLTVLNRVESAGRQLMQSLDDVLLLAQAKAGILSFSPVSVNLEQFCRDMVEEVQRLHAESYRIVCRAHFDTAIRADKKYLHHMLSNLLWQAMRHSRVGGEIVVVLHRQMDDVVIKVRDQSPGLPPEEQARLRTALAARQDNDSEDDLDELNLALAVIKYTVAAHNGRFSFQSEAEEGTIFTVTLPVNLTAES